jgi:hypothetical protein
VGNKELFPWRAAQGNKGRKEREENLLGTSERSLGSISKKRKEK